MDATNQRARNGGSRDFADDRVTDYTLQQMLTAMVGADGLHMWGSKLFNGTPGHETREGVWDVIDFYDEVREAGKAQWLLRHHPPWPSCRLTSSPPQSRPPPSR